MKLIKPLIATMLATSSFSALASDPGSYGYNVVYNRYVAFYNFDSIKYGLHGNDRTQLDRESADINAQASEGDAMNTLYQNGSVLPSKPDAQQIAPLVLAELRKMYVVKADTSPVEVKKLVAMGTQAMIDGYAGATAPALTPFFSEQKKFISPVTLECKVTRIFPNSEDGKPGKVELQPETAIIKLSADKSLLVSHFTRSDEKSADPVQHEFPAMNRLGIAADEDISLVAANEGGHGTIVYSAYFGGVSDRYSQWIMHECATKAAN